MEIEKHFEKLKKIEKVEAPPFLFTRIQARIDDLNAVAPVGWKWAFACSAVVILLLNFGVAVESLDNRQENKVDEIVSFMHLSTPNTLYHE